MSNGRHTYGPTKKRIMKLSSNRNVIVCVLTVTNDAIQDLSSRVRMPKLPVLSRSGILGEVHAIIAPNEKDDVATIGKKISDP